MSTTEDADWPQPDKDSSNDELVVDIAHTREQLGQTVDALSEKFDLKAQARGRVQNAKATAAHTWHDAKGLAATQFQVARTRVERAVARAKDAAADEQGHVKPAVPVAAAVAAAATIGAVVAIVVRGRRR